MFSSALPNYNKVKTVCFLDREQLKEIEIVAEAEEEVEENAEDWPERSLSVGYRLTDYREGFGAASPTDASCLNLSKVLQTASTESASKGSRSSPRIISRIQTGRST